MNKSSNTKKVYILSKTEKVVVYCQKETENILLIEKAINEIQCGNKKLCLSDNGKDIFVFAKNILFIEALDGKVYVHTVSQSYTSQNKLYELEKILPSFFIRISKSTLVNMNYFKSIKREKSGIGQLFISDLSKPLYFSRMYYKNIKEYLNKT